MKARRFTMAEDVWRLIAELTDYVDGLCESISVLPEHERIVELQQVVLLRGALSLIERKLAGLPG